MSSRIVTYLSIKRLLDILVAVGALTALAPLLLLIGILVRLDSNGPALFTQERAGKDGKPFRIFKFRTMYVVQQDLRGVQAKRDPRITRVGHWLRRLSFDELPQIVNILRGEMSLIGPRPMLTYHLERLDDQQIKRIQVRPGLTGWAQVNGRNSLSWEEKLQYDVEYVERCSFRLDFFIVLRSFHAMFDQSGIYFSGKGTGWQAAKIEKLEQS